MENDAESSIDWLLAVSEEAHQRQLDTIDKLRERIAFISGILLTPTFGAIVFLLTTYGGNYFSGISFWLFTVPLLIAILILVTSLSLALYVLSRGFEYKAGVSPPDLLQYFLGGADICKSRYDTKYVRLKSLNESISHNSKINALRMKGVLRSQVAATIAIPFLLISLPCYLYPQERQNIESPAVEIYTNKLLEVFMSKDNENASSSPLPPPVASAVPKPLIPEPTRPAPPIEKLFDSVSPPKGAGQQTLK